MKSSEMKIGNLALGSSPFKIDSKSIVLAEMHEKSFNEPRWLGVPLTPKLIDKYLQLDYERDELDDPFKFCKGRRTINLYIGVNDHIPIVLYQPNIGINYIDLNVEIEFIHEFQDLYKLW